MRGWGAGALDIEDEREKCALSFELIVFGAVVVAGETDGLIASGGEALVHGLGLKVESFFDLLHDMGESKGLGSVQDLDQGEAAACGREGILFDLLKNRGLHPDPPRGADLSVLLAIIHGWKWRGTGEICWQG